MEAPMRIRTLFLLLVVALIAVFVAINWSAFSAPTRLSLLVAQVEVPVGLVALGLAVLVVLAFGIYLTVWRSSILLESRQQTKALEAQRALAEQAEISRIAQLRETILHEMETLGNRITQIQNELRTEIRESSNSLAATIGEIDDRVQSLLKRDPA
jgi:uncharacterized integral membrane protein